MKDNPIQKIYGMASILGMVERSSKEDALRQLVYGIAGKASVRELTQKEQNAVIAELRKRLRAEHPNSQKEPQKSYPNKMTPNQKSKAWALLHELAELTPSDAEIEERMAGIVRKELHITSSAADPLRWASFRDGFKLIEQLKRYVQHAKEKAAIQDESG